MEECRGFLGKGGGLKIWWPWSPLFKAGNAAGKRRYLRRLGRRRSTDLKSGGVGTTLGWPGGEPRMMTEQQSWRRQTVSVVRHWPAGAATTTPGGCGSELPRSDPVEQ
ncbi:hypothetical protein M6B38_328195 [Iris pallida]|uniref:Uncharacterized protein n=1 Tax=Iris pallida TaxID=29817 RepID=A0AAX6H7K9_IRIPA|nr:hypothetical protein M6B38_328195 [Iris pallida]